MSEFVWTIQPEEVWRKLKECGSISVDPRRIAMHDHQRWLYQQLRLKFPGVLSAKPPWWFYCQKPDLRKFRHREPAGSVHYRLKCRVPDRGMVFIPSRMWDAVLVGFEIPGDFDETTWELFSGDLGDRLDPDHAKEVNERIVHSWTRLINRASTALNPLNLHDLEGLKSRLFLKEIAEVTPFVGTRR